MGNFLFGSPRRAIKACMNAKTLEIHQPAGYCYTYSESHPPVARVKPGERVRIHCVDCFENRLSSESMSFGEVCEYPYLNPQTGPVHVEGAEPGDTLLVHVEDIEITRDWAVSGLVPRFGLLTGTSTTSLLTPALKETVRKLPIRYGRVHFGRRSRPLAPFMGTMGTAPKLEAINALTPFSYGGNMDCPETCPGNTVHLPVRVDGALFFCGDGHAAQGHGEIGGVACEVPVNLVCRFELLKGQTIRWPRITNDHYFMTVGSARPLEDATRIACSELVEWVAESTGLSLEDALVWTTQVVELRVGNVCDPNYSVVAAIPKAAMEETDRGL